MIPVTLYFEGRTREPITTTMPAIPPKGAALYVEDSRPGGHYYAVAEEPVWSFNNRVFTGVSLTLGEPED